MKQRGAKKISGPEFWPAIDRSLYLDGAGRGSRRTGQRRYRSLSPSTRLGNEHDYDASLRWQQGKGQFEAAASPAARWPADVVEDMAVDMLGEGYSVASVRSRVGRLKRVLAVMEPDASLEHFDALLRQFEQPKARFDPIVWKISAADLQAFGIESMENAGEISAVAGVPAGANFCLGLQIALIAARPWRRRTFTAMELWVNIKREGGNWRMMAHPHGNKQRRYQSGLVPTKLVPYLETYIDEHRTDLCKLSGYAGSALWINEKGRPMTPQQFYKAFTRLTEEKFGERVTVHAVRKIAATTMARHDPRNVYKIQGILGHASYEISERHYVLASAIQAHSDLDATIDRLQRSAQERRRLSRRK